MNTEETEREKRNERVWLWRVWLLWLLWLLLSQISIVCDRVRTCFVYLKCEGVGYCYIVVIRQNQLIIFIHARSTNIGDYSGTNYLLPALVVLAKIGILRTCIRV